MFRMYVAPSEDVVLFRYEHFKTVTRKQSTVGEETCDMMVMESTAGESDQLNSSEMFLIKNISFILIIIRNVFNKKHF